VNLVAFGPTVGVGGLEDSSDSGLDLPDLPQLMNMQVNRKKTNSPARLRRMYFLIDVSSTYY
jgi:hypothetical protein